MLHTVSEVYVRHGPMAEEIGQIRPPLGLEEFHATPLEHSVIESWMEFASPLEYTRLYSILRDTDDNTIQEHRSDPQWLEAGTTGPVNAPALRAQGLKDQLREGTAQVLEQAEDSITVESRSPYPETFPRGRGDDSIEVPYVTNLSPVEWVHEVSIRSDGILLYGHDYVITETGEKVLVHSTELVAIEILDSAPPGIFEE